MNITWYKSNDNNIQAVPDIEAYLTGELSDYTITAFTYQEQSVQGSASPATEPKSP